MRVLLATNNRHKLTEFRRLLGPDGFEVLSPRDLNISLEVEETGRTFADNATLKATAFHSMSGLITLADDSGLVVDALGGEPGVYSARYGGDGLDDWDRLQLVLERMRGVPDECRSARFVASIAVVVPEAAPEVIERAAEGRITHEPVGEGGFGYDPIFCYPPLGATFAQLSGVEKDAVSHRGQAARAAAAYLHTLKSDGILS